MSAQAAHEPSMEDILASIRKIISEDGNDQNVSEAPAVPPVTAQAVPAVPQLDNIKVPTPPLVPSRQEPAAAVLPPVEIVERRESFDSHREATPPIDVAPRANPTTEAQAERPITPVVSGVDLPGFVERKPGSNMPDITSVFRGTASAQSADADIGLHPAIAEAKKFARDSRQDEGSLDAMQHQEKPVFQNSDALAVPQSGSSTLLSPESVERREEEERRNHPLRRGADREDEEVTNALMSPQTDDAVGSAFEQLKNSAMDNLDGKVDALLRPMLREWLDNNLPSMVERLVRDEIERVSRGD